MEKKFFENKNTPYRVPETFFDDFHGRLSAKIKEEKERRRSKILRIVGSAAAAVLIVVTTTIAVNEGRQHRLHEQELAALAESPEKYMSDEKLEAWVDFYENDLFINAQYSN